MAVFVNILGNAPGYDNDAQRLVRSHVMKGFRQKEREAARRKWKIAAEVMSCGPKKSQFMLLDDGGRGTEEPHRPRGQTSQRSTLPEDILDSNETHTERDKPFSKGRHVSKSPKPCDKQRKSRRGDVPSTHPDHPRRPTTTALSRKIHLTNNIIDVVRSPEQRWAQSRGILVGVQCFD